MIWRTFFHHKEPFEKHKGSSDVKGSLWNHLDKNREASLFFKRCTLNYRKTMLNLWLPWFNYTNHGFFGFICSKKHG